MAFVQANNFRVANRDKDNIERIILHTTESPERREGAEDIASFFSNPTTQVSAHKVVDNNSVVQCVRDKDIAFHALGDNDQSLGIEQVGKAGQTFKEWRDDYSLALIELSAEVCAGWADAYGIPVRLLSDDQLERRLRGFATHDAVSRVFGDDIRDDPGRNFPFDRFFDRVEFYLARLNAPTAWVVSFVDVNEERTEGTTKDPDEWAASHPAAFKRGRVTFLPKRD